MTHCVDLVKETWGDVPNWVMVLAEECDRTSQNKAGIRIGRKGPLVNAVLHRKYAGNYDRVEEAVRGVFLKETVLCPELGELPKQDCLAWRKKSRSFSGHNALRVAMYRACKRCPISKAKEEQSDDANE